TPRGVAVTPARASGHVVAEAGGEIRVGDLRLATERTRLDADGQLLPAREVRARLGLVLDAGELRALVPGSRLVTNVAATASAAVRPAASIAPARESSRRRERAGFASVSSRGRSRRTAWRPACASITWTTSSRDCPAGSRPKPTSPGAGSRLAHVTSRGSRG